MQEDKKIEEYVIVDDMDDEDRGSEGGWKDKLLDFLDNKYFVPIVIILIAIIAFSLGRVSGLQEKKTPVRILNNSTSVSVGEVKGASNNSSPNPLLLQQEKGASEKINTSANSSGKVVGSKNSTKYHYPWCGGAKRISPQNLITFDSIDKARAAGYLPAANCKGLK